MCFSHTSNPYVSYLSSMTVAGGPTIQVSRQGRGRRGFTRVDSNDMTCSHDNVSPMLPTRQFTSRWDFQYSILLKPFRKHDKML